jgi:hypothetical protein
MKKKMLSMAAAITMTVVVLTGCSAGFNRDFVIEAAKEYGMDDTRALYESAQISNVDVKAYYISDSKQADVMRHMFTHAGLDTEYDIKETILFSEVKANKSGDVTDVNSINQTTTRILYMTAADAKTAKEIYAVNAEWIMAHEGTSGKQKGVEYAIKYTAFTTDDDREAESFYGVYIKGKTVIWLEAFSNNGPNDDCTKYFCDKLGLVSPLTLRK